MDYVSAARGSTCYTEGMDDTIFLSRPVATLSRQGATDNDTDFSLSLEEVAARYARAGHPRTLRSLQRYCVSGHLDARKIATAIGDKYLVTPQSIARHIAQIVELSQLDAVATCRDMSHRTRQQLYPNPKHDSAENSISMPDMSRQGTTETIPPVENSRSSPNAATRHATEHDRSRQATTDTMPQVIETPVPPQKQRHEAPTERDMARQSATEPVATGEPARYVTQLEHNSKLRALR